MHAAVNERDDLQTLRLVASALPGGPWRLRRPTCGDASWCDGTTVFVELGVSTEDHIRMLAVQASLVAAGSFDPAILRHLPRRPGLSRRYLAVEGHRALLANEPVLPPFVCSLIDHDLARSATTAEGTLALAGGYGAGQRPPRVFGVIDAKRSLTSIERASGAPIGRSVDVQRGRASGPLVRLEEDEPGRRIWPTCCRVRSVAEEPLAGCCKRCSARLDGGWRRTAWDRRADPQLPPGPGHGHDASAEQFARGSAIGGRPGRRAVSRVLSRMGRGAWPVPPRLVHGHRV